MGSIEAAESGRTAILTAQAVEAEPVPVSDGATQRRARLALAFVLLGLGLWMLRSFLPALAWAAVLAVATWPLYRRAERRFGRGRHHLLLPALFTAGAALIVLVPLAIAGLQLAREGASLFHLFEEVRRSGLPAPDWLARLPVGAAAATAWWQQNLADPAASSELVGRLSHGSLVGYTRSFGAQIVRRAIVFGFTLVTLFFLYREGDRLADALLRIATRTFGPHGEALGRQIVASVHGTVDGLVLVGLGEGVLIGIAYAVAGVPHPTLFGAATAIAAMVPFLAPIVICLAVLPLLAAGSVVPAGAVVAFGFAVVFAADHFVRPVLIGGATKLPFLWVLLGILGGVEAFGLLGLFLGPAIMAALILIWRDWAKPDRTTPGLIIPATPADLGR